MHVPKDERSELDDKAKQCIFLGYGHEKFWYKLWDSVDRKLVRSQAIVFLEHQTIQNFEKIVKPQTTVEDFVDLGLVPSPTVKDDRTVAPDDNGNEM